MNYAIRLTTVILLTALATGGSCLAAEPTAADFKFGGMAAYQKGNYKAAAFYLSKATVGEANPDGTLHYYLANALMKTGDYVGAQKEYRIAMIASDEPKLQKFCTDALTIIDQKLAGKAVLPAETKAATPSSNTRRAAQTTEGSPQDLALIKVLRTTSETAAVQSKIARALSYIPNFVKDEFRSKGMHILIVPTMMEFQPTLATERPPGYNSGGGFDNVAGQCMYSEKQIVIPERVSWLNSPPQINNRILPVMMHESGHAFDFCKGTLSDQGEFMAAYKEDQGHLTNSLITQFDYFLQPDRGSHELFAQLFAESLGRTNHVRTEEPGLPAAFPKSSELMKRYLDQ